MSCGYLTLVLLCDVLAMRPFSLYLAQACWFVLVLPLTVSHKNSG